MPKLDSRLSSKVDETEATHGGNFEPIAAGKYIARLEGVSVRDELNKFDAAQWSAEFSNLTALDDGSTAPGRQWLNLTLPTTNEKHPKYEKDAGKWENYQNMLFGRLAAFFEAFGYTADSDTDEIVGEWAVITVSIRTIQSGPRKGEKTNSVDDIEEVPEGVEIPEVDGNIAAQSGDTF